MAQFIPSLDDIRNLTVKPQEGELYLLEFLDRVLDDTFEVYFNPYMNGDRPDVIIIKEGQGVMIIEVKDWNLDSYELDVRKNWKVKNHKNEFTIKSPISQVLKYKENLFDLHIEKLLEYKIRDIRNFNTVTCAVYFHNASQKKIEDLLVNPFNDDRKYQDFLKYNIDLIGRDSLNNDDFKKILKTRPLISNKFASFFTDDLYKSIRRFISPTIHMKEEGKSMNYSEQQGKIIYDTTRKQIRVKGVVGSGKTTVLAARAVNLYKRTRGEILILTFNITLRNFIRDKINNIREDFPLNNFIILNYHFFIKAELNNIGISIEIPDNFEKFTTEKKSEYFEKRYFSNIRLFEYLKELDLIKKYDVILIDEVQDYKRPWLDIIKNYFLTEGGYYMLLGDVKQNIYMTPTENKDVSVNISGRGDELKNCLRSDFRIKDLAIEFQKEFYKDKYEIDDFNKNEIDNSNTNPLGLSFTKQGTINYIYLTGETNTNNNSIKALYTIIHENAINKGINPNDITILSQTIHFLRDFDAFYRYRSQEKTNTMFETWETIYKLGFNFLPKDTYWLQEGLCLVNFHKNKIKGTDILCKLFTLYNLYEKHPNIFSSDLYNFCHKMKISEEKIIDFMQKNEVLKFKKDTPSKKLSPILETIRDNKKYNFWFNSGTVKLSTVHSFKGWESELLFLIIEPKYKDSNKFNIAFDEILYTGITRSRSQLVIINYGNTDYHEKLKKIVDKVK